MNSQTSAVFAQTQAVSPEQSQIYWDSIRKADAKTQKVNVSWEAVRTHLPNTAVTDELIESIVAKLGAQDKSLQINDNSTDAAKKAEFHRKQLLIERAGWNQTSQLLFTSAGQKVRADTIFEPQQYAGSTEDQTWRSHTIDFYDQQSSVTLDQFFDVAADGSVTKKSSWRGERWPAPKRALWRSAGTFAQRFFLTGQSVILSHDPAKTTIREGQDDTIVLEMDAPDEPDHLYRTIISKETWKPLSSETIIKSSNYLLLRIEAKDYKQYDGGIWFPSELNERFGRRLTSRYKLKSVKFNDDVDSTGLLLPAGAILRDDRFGEVLSYKITDGCLPCDATVRKIVGKGNISQPSSKLVLIAGLLLMGISCVWWIRQGKKEPS
jgi:hypothetical protein